MEKRLKLKKGVITSLYIILVLGIIVGSYAVSNILKKPVNDNLLTYVSSSIISSEIPVIKETTKIVNPYNDATVKTEKYFYDYQADKARQEQSITTNDNTYMQNSGVDFTCDKIFDVVAVMEGTVTNVKDDDLLGKTVEIKHDDKYISVYQSMSEVNVKKGDIVTQGQILGKSGTNEIDKDMGNHLHFEFYYNGQVVNPESYLNKGINEINNQ